MNGEKSDSGGLPFLPREWLASAADAGTALGIGMHFPEMSDGDWSRIVWNVGQTMTHRGVALPPEWEHALARQAGRPDDLGRDLTDAKLAEQGEVFSREDDA